MHDGAFRKKTDPYRKLEVIQGEGPTLCMDCVHPRYENGGVWHHPKNLEDGYKKIALCYPGTWRCSGTPDKEINLVTGNLDYEKLPKCEKQNDGSCIWYAEYYEPIEEEAAIAKSREKPWWKFW